jgi:hypothetical protein
VDLLAIRQKLEVPLDHAGQPIRLGDAQAEAVFVDWTGGGILELAQRLRGVAEPNVPTDKCAKRLADHGLLRVITLTDP